MVASTIVNPGTHSKATNWHAINWQAAYASVKNLRQRIYKARADGNKKKVRDLQMLVLRSHANLLVYVRRASQLKLIGFLHRLMHFSRTLISRCEASRDPVASHEVRGRYTKISPN